SRQRRSHQQSTTRLIRYGWTRMSVDAALRYWKNMGVSEASSASSSARMGPHFGYRSVAGKCAEWMGEHFTTTASSETSPNASGQRKLCTSLSGGSERY